ncbi:MAG TPA: lytic murein transglycosylase [Rubrobacter sp.]|nr:lytic murein transglycosylase [Rubrobacter sp.]
MSGGHLRVWSILGVLSLALVLAGTEEPARAQSADEAASVAGSTRVPLLEGKISDQDAALRDVLQEISTVGAELDRAQSRADDAGARVEDLRRQIRRLKRQIAEQDAAFREAQARYRAQAQAAYKGGSLEGLAALLDGWFFDSWEGVAGTGDPVVARILLDSRQNLAAYREARQTLRNTQRQIAQKRRDYNAAIEEQQATTADLRLREQALDRSIDRLGTNSAPTEARLQRLRAAERTRIQKSAAATGGGEVDSEHELEVAREDIVATSVEPTSKNRYMELYKASATKYGFGPDWYILVAVGKVESNHGQTMGPSSAGAMGPMQFMPSTWETSGVDGDGDGVANVMDPEDAIPAAASYLDDGGAPQDWYRALYSYNHADWYVKKVVAVAEAYRRLAKDESVGPYI